MEGPQPPGHTDASEAANHDSETLHIDPTIEDATSQTDSTSKRPHDDGLTESKAKKPHIDDADPDDLDLDALMAQLQQHAERATAGDGTNDAGEKNASTSKDSAPETELSIEQQLKGALSSLQDLDEDGDGDLGDDEDAANALDQLTKILAPSAPLTDKADAAKDTAASVTEEKDLTQPREEASPSSGASASQSVDHVSADQEKFTEAPAQSQNRKQPEDGQLKAPGPSLPLSESQEVSKDTDAEERKSGKNDSTRSKEDLLSKMPPPPAHMGGTLPPMPPPPPALTSPTAPLTAIELARNSSRAGSSHGETAQDKMLNSRIQKLYSPTFSEVPPLSQSVQSALADQVDKAAEDTNDSAKEESYSVLLLNDNQAILQSRKRSLGLLDSLASQVLDVLSFNHYQETLATVMQPESERGTAYRILLDAFEDVKRIFFKWKSQSSRLKPEPKPEEIRPFLSYNIPGVEPTRENLTTLQRANLATFVAAVFGTIEIGFWELDRWFLKVFVPDNGRLLKQQAQIYLDLKTQAYISAVESSDDKEMHRAALEHLFPEDLETRMQELLGERMTLAPSEQDFVAKCHRRRDNIKAEDEKDLSTKYHWVPFLREVSDYISRNHYTLLPQRKHAPSVSEAADSPSTVPRTYVSQRRQTSVPPPPVVSEVSRASSGSPRRSSNTSEAEKSDSGVSQTAKKPAGLKSELEDPSQKSESTLENKDGTTTTRSHPDIPAEGHPLFPPLPKQVLPPPSLSSSNADATSQRQQTFERSRRPGPRPHSQAPVAANSPTDTLAVYEAAKASAEGTDAIRPKTSLFTTRRTWTKEEEEALLKGMDRVQGPYWAQILELYGPGGKISEVLKDRSQVQLKDKARNLKMFFLRLGLPIPAVFQYVTGDYETRRSSGKKGKERRQQKAGPSDLSQNASIARPPQVPQVQETQIRSVVNVNSQPPQSASTAASRESQSTAPAQAAPAQAAPAQAAPAPAPRKESQQGAESTTNSETRNLETGRPAGGTADSRVLADKADASSAAESGEDPGSSNVNATATQQPQPDSVEPKTSTGMPEGDQNQKDVTTPLVLSEGAAKIPASSVVDKEEDLSTLLHRVGKYVENQ